MVLVNDLTLKEINSALLSIVKTTQNKSSNTLSEYNSDDKIGTSIIYCGDVDEDSTDRIEIYKGWLLCNGAEIDVNSHYNLFKVIGRKYGDGDGNSTFNLPNWIGVMEDANYIIKYE